MDPLTHTGVGFTIAQAGGKRLTPNWAWVMLIACGAPDVDVLFFLPGDPAVLNWHRHFSHALFFSPLVAVAVVAAVKYVLRRDVHWRGGIVLAWLGVVGHDLVDFLTYRGTRILLPFSDQRYALGIEPFFDPVLYLLFALAIAVPFLSNLVSGEIGAKKGSGALAAWLMMIVAVGWLGARYMFREQALGEITSRIYEGAAPRRLDILPTIHPFHFVGFVRGDKFNKILDVDLFDYFDPESGQLIFDQVPSVESGKAIRLATASRSAQIMLAWARWPSVTVTRYDGETRWVVVVEELAVDRNHSRPRVIVKLDENYAIQSEVYERSKGSTGF